MKLLYVLHVQTTRSMARKGSFPTDELRYHTTETISLRKGHVNVNMLLITQNYLLVFVALLFCLIIWTG